MSQPPSDTNTGLLGRIAQLWINYLTGQMLLGVIIGCVVWIVDAAIGLEWALTLGVLAGLLQTIPAIGPPIAIVPAFAVALWKGSSVIAVDNWVFALIVLAVYLAIQQLSQIAIEPRVMGKRLNVPPLAVLAAVIVGTALAGIIGAYLATPVLASILEIVRYAQDARRPPTQPG